MRPAASSRLVLAILTIGVSMSGASGDSRVAVPAALTGATLDGEMVGASPFLDPPAFDPSDGALLFRAALSRGLVPEGIFRQPQPGGAAVLLAGAGLAAAPGTVFSRFLRPAGCAGRAAFWAGLRSAPPLPSADGGSGIFIWDGSAVAAAVLAGDSAPGGGLITALGSSPDLDETGRLRFLAATDQTAGVVLLERSLDGILTEALTAGMTTVDGIPIVEILDADAGCGESMLALVRLDQDGVTPQALLRAIPGGWQTLLTEFTAIPGGGQAGPPRLPALQRADGTLRVVVDRPAGAGAALLRVAGDGSIDILTATGDPVAGGSLATLGAPAPWDPSRVALLAGITPDLPPGAGAVPAILAVADDGGTLVAIDASSRSPAGVPLSALDDPAGDNAGHLCLRAQASSAGEAGLLHVGGSAPDLWLARAGEDLAPWGRLLAGGLRAAGPTVDGQGQAAFVATLPPGRDGDALFLAAPGAIPRRLLQPGDLLTDGLPLIALEGPPHAGADGVVWMAARVGDVLPRVGYLRIEEASAALLVLAEGDPSPLGGTLRTLGRVVSADASNRLVFTATLSGAASASAVLSFSEGGGLQALAAAGAAAPGGGNWTAFGFAPKPLGAWGAGFLAYTAGQSQGSGIYVADAPGAYVGAVALSGTPAPGGGLFASFRDPVAGGGILAFSALLDDGGAAIFTWDGSTLARAVRVGDPLPGGGHASGLTALALDGAGSLLVAVEVTGAPWAAGIYRLDGSSAAPLLTSGAMVPLEDGAAATLAGFTALAAGGVDGLAISADLGGWSYGAAVLHASLDGDGDGWGDPIDCALGDPAAWQPPGVARLELSPGAAPAQSVLSWSDLAAAAGPGTLHELARGRISDLRADSGLQSASCAAGPLAGSSAEIEDGTPQPGDAFWYLVRGRNACGPGATGAADRPRLLPGSLCPAS